MKQRIRSTTVICVRRDGKVVMAGDGQVTLGNEVLKASAKKLRRLYNDKILACGFGNAGTSFRGRENIYPDRARRCKCAARDADRVGSYF